MKKHFKTAVGMLTVMLLTVVVVLGMTAKPAKAEEDTSSFHFSYKDGGYIIERYIGSSENVKIPASVGGHPVVGIGTDAFYMKSFIKSVEIPNTVTSIGSNAFLQCTNLKSITIPSSVTTMGGSIFFGCTNLETVKIENGLTTICFYTFKDCPKLKNVNIPSSVTEIEDFAFCNCDSLQKVSVPKTVTKMSTYSFHDCPALTAINVASDNPNYCSVNGVLFNKDKTTLMRYPQAKKDESYTTPDTITYIHEDAFSKNPYLKSVTIKGKPSRITYRVFEHCTALTSVKFPDTLLYIDERAFNGCTSLKTLHLPVSVKSIRAKAFVDCNKLSKITVDSANPNVVSVDGVVYTKDMKYLLYYPMAKTGDKYAIPEGVEGLVDYCLFGPRYLKELTIPSTVTYIGTRSIYKEVAVKIGTKSTPFKINNKSQVSLAFTVDNSDILSVSSSGTITAKAAGTTNITSVDEHMRIVASVEFHDVTSSDKKYYYDAVYWAAKHGITGGVKDSKTGKAYNFDPEGNCTRAQMAAFLWRIAECPEPRTTTCPFTDIKPTDYYYKAVLWGTECNIIGGYSDHTFRPQNTCTRQQAVTFLWRMAGKPEPTVKTSPFSDVKNSNTYYYKAVLWASENGITGGYSDGTFRPSNECSRAQIVTFIYRFCGGAHEYEWGVVWKDWD